MRSTLPLLLLAPALFAAAPLAPADDEAPGFRWESDLKAARQRSAREGKPLLLVLRCPP